MKVAKARSLYLGSEEDLVEWSIYTPQRTMGRTMKDFDERIKWPQKFDSEILPGVRALQHSPRSTKVAHLEQLEASLVESTNNRLRIARRVRRIRTTFLDECLRIPGCLRGPRMRIVGPFPIMRWLLVMQEMSRLVFLQIESRSSHRDWRLLQAVNYVPMTLALSPRLFTSFTDSRIYFNPNRCAL